MPRVHIALRTVPVFRFEAFHEGFRRLGYDIAPAVPNRIETDDVLVIWNRRADQERMARAYEAAGARVVVAENAYLQPGRDKHFALALGHHNGAGTWPYSVKGWPVLSRPERWPELDIRAEPWRETGDFIVVLPQRGIGERGVAMPHTWLAETLTWLRAATRRPVRVRRHPGNGGADPSPDFRDAWAAVTWGSGAAIKAVVAGVPVFHGLRSWIGAPAAHRIGHDLERPYLGYRIPMLERLAWAQWSVAEVESGEAFRWLLG